MNSYYAAKYNDKAISKISASGGVFYALAEYVLQKNGIVFGAAFQEDLKVKHIMVTSYEDLSLLQGSKYVQSYMGDIFLAVHELLVKGKMVLFSGTPCQIHGLHTFLKVKNSFFTGQFFTVEIICHGVPSPGVFANYLDYLQNNCGKKITEYYFKTKDLNKAFTIKYIADKVYYANALKDPFYAAFLADLILRPSCYECKFYGEEREADITLGDFWGIEKTNVNNKLKEGCSLIGCNSEAGLSLLNNIWNVLEIEQVRVESAISAQPQLKNNKRDMSIPKDRKKVFEVREKNSSVVFFNFLKVISIDKKKIFFNSLPHGLRKIIKRIKS